MALIVSLALSLLGAAKFGVTCQPIAISGGASHDHSGNLIGVFSPARLTPPTDGLAMLATGMTKHDVEALLGLPSAGFVMLGCDDHFAYGMNVSVSFDRSQKATSINRFSNKIERLLQFP